MPRVLRLDEDDWDEIQHYNDIKSLVAMYSMAPSSPEAVVYRLEESGFLHEAERLGLVPLYDKTAAAAYRTRMENVIAEDRERHPERYNFAPDTPVCPGETITEYLEEKELSADQLAEATGIPLEHLTLLLTGDAELTEDDARDLELVTDIRARFWLALEANYREALSRRSAV